MADMESICARLCLLTRAAWKEGLPPPFSRADVAQMIRLGAIEGLTLRRVPGVKEECYLRAEALLSRSGLIYHAVMSGEAQGYRVILPEDDAWPVQLFRLGEHMPQFLFVYGNQNLFQRRSLAVAGSRRIAEKTAEIAKSIGKEMAQQGYTLVSGGAQGVDTAAQRACLDAGGNFILIPAYPAHAFLCRNDIRSALDEGRLLMVFETWPDECFSAHKALSRNHAIYALGDAAIVVAARKGKGGTWRGAVDCLRGQYAPVYAVNHPGADFDGCRALLALGAREWDPARSAAQQLMPRGE